MKLFGIPGAPLALTLAGIAPFAAGAGVMWAAQADPVLQAQAGLTLLVYGAVILSFVGGLRWGAEIAASEAPRAAVLALWHAVFGASEHPPGPQKPGKAG